MTAEAFDGTPAIGKYVGFVADSTKAKVQDTADASTFGTITDKDITGFGEGKYEYFYITLK